MRGVAAILAIVAALGVGVVAGVAVGTAPDRSATPDIPRCVSDDYNDGSQWRCWTESAEGVLVIDATDTVVSIPQPADVTVAPCEWWADGTPSLPADTRTDACVTPDGALSTPGK